MSREEKARERKLKALAAGEARVQERLYVLRTELDVLTRSLDRVLLPRRSRMYAGDAAGAGLSDIGKLVALSSYRKPPGGP